MRRLLAAMLAAGMVSGALLAQSAPRPSLNGTWVQDTQPVPIAGRVPLCAARCVITQTGDSIEVSDGMHHNAYTADGVPHVAIATTATLTATITTTTTWERATLVIVVTTVSADVNAGKPMTTTSRLSIADGRLIIEGSRANPDGSQDTYRVLYRPPQ